MGNRCSGGVKEHAVRILHKWGVLAGWIVPVPLAVSPRGILALAVALFTPFRRSIETAGMSCLLNPFPDLLRILKPPLFDCLLSPPWPRPTRTPPPPSRPPRPPRPPPRRPPRARPRARPRERPRPPPVSDRRPLKEKRGGVGNRCSGGVKERAVRILHKWGVLVKHPLSAASLGVFRSH